MARRVNFEDSETTITESQQQEASPSLDNTDSDFGDTSATITIQRGQQEKTITTEQRREQEAITKNQHRQKDDQDAAELALVENAFVYLTKKTYPPGSSKNDKRTIRRKAERLTERDGEIFYKKRGGSTVSLLILAIGIIVRIKTAKYLYLMMQVRLIVNSDEKQKILDSCRTHPTSGHLGVRRTLSRITERFMWAGVTKDVIRMVRFLYVLLF